MRKDAMHNKINKIELTFIAIVAMMMGIIWCFYTVLYDVIAPALKIFACDGLLTGIWLMGGLFFPYVIRKPFSAILGESIAGITEGIISEWGIMGILYGASQGIIVELLFLVTRYRNFSLTIMIIAGAISGFFSCLMSIWLYQFYHFGFTYCLIELFTSSISGILAGIFSFYLANRLTQTGVLNQFNIVKNK